MSRSNTRYMLVNILFIISAYSLHKFDYWATDFVAFGMLTAMALYNCGHAIKFNNTITYNKCNDEEASTEDFINEPADTEDNEEDSYKSLFKEYNISTPTKGCLDFCHYSYKDIDWYYYYDEDTKKYYISNTTTFDNCIEGIREPSFHYGNLIVELGHDETYIGNDDTGGPDCMFHYTYGDAGYTGGFRYFVSYHYGECCIGYGEELELGPAVNAITNDCLMFDDVYDTYKYNNKEFIVVKNKESLWISNNENVGEFYKIEKLPVNSEEANNMYMSLTKT